jgi:hypothetical protein
MFDFDYLFFNIYLWVVMQLVETYLINNPVVAERVEKWFPKPVLIIAYIVFSIIQLLLIILIIPVLKEYWCIIFK